MAPTPAKKATPALKDLLEDKQTEDPQPVDTETEKLDVVFVDSDKDHVNTWKEDHDQNLARVQKDVVEASPPSEYAKTSRVVDEVVYAKPDSNDDVGRNRLVSLDEDDEDVPPNAGSVD